ncbi:MAG: glucoamylase family protein [Ferruginibacter sp.]
MLHKELFGSLIVAMLLLFVSCKKNADSPGNIVTSPAENFRLNVFTINNNNSSNIQYGIPFSPLIKITFTAPVKRSTIAAGIILQTTTGATTGLNAVFQNGDSVVSLQPASPLNPITKYTLTISTVLTSQQNISLAAGSSAIFITAIDSSDKFPIISDNTLLDKIQQQTFKYFWDFGHPVSGMARERNSSGETVTTGGTGFGIMAIVTAVSRGFITRTEGRDRVLKITDFLTTNCTRYHGAFAHWINGTSGVTIPFSPNDNGGDLVETSLLMQGLITARQYFSAADVTETELRNKINVLWYGVEWSWYRQNNQNVLYWHWSPDKAFIINQQISGWDEALIVYVLAASDTVAANKIPKIVYDNGWARNGGFKNNGTFYGYQLPLGPDLGGPLFFSHYSFLGINPNGLNDAYANYTTQVSNHAKINYEYCKANPKNWYGYSSLSWGLTASDIPNGYDANAPGNKDIGVITPTAAISSMPYTPTESMNALRFFYYKLGDKMWGQYGFYDAYKLSDPWFATSTLAIDQGPMIVMIENFRSGLLWNLFTGAPEIKTGMKSLGFTAPYLP